MTTVSNSSNAVMRAIGGPGIMFKRRDEVEIARADISRCYELHTKGYWPVMCRRFLKELMVNKEPHFIVGEQTHTTSQLNPTFRQIVRNYWMPFMHEVMDEIIVAGFVAIRFPKLPGTGDRIPKVLKSADYGRSHVVSVRHEPKTSSNVYTVYRVKKITGDQTTLTDFELDRTSYVLANFNWEPTTLGRVQSIAASLLPWEDWMVKNQQFNMMAEYNLARPAIVTEMDSTAKQQSTGTERTDYYAEYDHLTSNSDAGLFVREQASPYVKAFKKLVDGDTGVQTGWFPPNSRELYMVQQHVRNVVPLPPGHHVARQQLATRNPQYENYVRMYEETISAGYGIPRTLIVQDSAMRASGNTQLVNQTLRHTVMMWTDIFSTIYTEVYRKLYAASDVSFVLNNLPRKGLKALTPKDLFDLTAAVQDVRVTIPVPPTASIEELQQLYIQGIITWKEYHAALRGLVGMPSTDPTKEPTKKQFQEMLMMIQGVWPKEQGESGSNSSGGSSSGKSSSSSSSSSGASKSSSNSGSSSGSSSTGSGLSSSASTSNLSV